MARRAHRSSILSSSRTPDQLRVPRSEHLVHFSRRRCFEHNQRPEHLTCRRPRLDVARRAHPWPGTWCTYRRSQYERYSLAVTSDGKVGPSGVVLRPPHGSKSDNVVVRPARIRSLGQRCSPRQSLQCRRQVSCPFPGEKYGTPRHPNLLSTPQVRASDLFDLTLNELSGFAAQAPDPVLQHVRRQTDGIHG